ncbi:MAG: hypothetical protein ACJ763_14180 [Bdellovibrionia bacterium]
MHSKKLMMVSFIALSLLGSGIAEAGPGSTGGGGAVMNGREAHALDLAKIPNREIYDLDESRGMDYLKNLLKKETAFSKTTVFYNNLSNDRSATTESAILGALNKLKFYKVPHELPALDDAGVIYLHKAVQGEIRRVALQFKDDFTVLVDRNILELYTDRDIASLLLHEALIRLYFDTNSIRKLGNTETISDVVSAVFSPDRRNEMSSKVLSRYLCDAHIYTANGAFEDLVRKGGLDGPEANGTVFGTFYTLDHSDCSVRTFKAIDSRFEIMDSRPSGFKSDTIRLVELFNGDQFEANMILYYLDKTSMGRSLHIYSYRDAYSREVSHSLDNGHVDLFELHK